MHKDIKYYFTNKIRFPSLILEYKFMADNVGSGAPAQE